MVKKQLIMEKALELFAKQGFEATSVQQITEYCGISKGAFYLSFKSKDELIISLIDHFMVQITSDIDHLVTTAADEENLLYKFYYAIFGTFQKHSDFAMVLFKEQSQTLNKDLILKMHYYDKLMEGTILSMVESLYGDAVKQTKYDLMFCIKGFMTTYSHLFLFYQAPVDLDLLSRSLVEKTDLLAEQVTIPFISHELNSSIRGSFEPGAGATKDELVVLIEEKMAEMEDGIEKESLLLLKEQVVGEVSYPAAVVQGLLENIQRHSHCKWISYLLRRYFD